MPERLLQTRISTTRARVHLSEIVTRIQDPRTYCVLTRHDKPVAAIVSMESYDRLIRQKDIEERTSPGTTWWKFRWVRLGYETPQLAAEAVQEVQMTRREEREILARGGLKPIPGGEMTMDVEMPVQPPARPWWRLWRKKAAIKEE